MTLWSVFTALRGEQQPAAALAVLALGWGLGIAALLLPLSGLPAAGAGLALAANGAMILNYLQAGDAAGAPDAFEALFERLEDPVIVLDPDARVRAANGAVGELLGYPEEQLLGEPFATALPDLLPVAQSNAVETSVTWQPRGDEVERNHRVVIVELADGGRALQLVDTTEHDFAAQRLQLADQRLEAANASVDRLTLCDELTGLANQRAFVDELEREVQRHRRSERRFGVISIEADHFQLLAEQHGVAFRDRALSLIARAIEVEVRDTDLCARLDGDEFAVLAVQMKAPSLVNLAERIRKRVLKVRPHSPDGERVRMSVSCGVGIFDPREDDLRRLLARTNQYLAEAKRTGRNKVVSGD
ncbi:MAG: diguanylate cyclase [Pseudomonadota bacterium]